jgi:predicted metal-dependent hydrolase
MGKQRLKKKPPDPTSTVVQLTPEDWEEFERGVGFFNKGQFKHAKEAWQQVSERQPGGGGPFFQGLIQLAAMCQKHAIAGDGRTLKPAGICAQLEPYQPEHLGVMVTTLVESLSAGIEKGEPPPKIQFHKPANPDLLVELCEMLHSEEFLQGAKLFNQGYHWEAHEAWEEICRAQEGEAKEFAQAFVQLASACRFGKLGKLDSARYLLEKSIGTLQEYEHLECGMSFSDLMAALERSFQQLLHAQNGTKHSFTPPRVPLA